MELAYYAFRLICILFTLGGCSLHHVLHRKNICFIINSMPLGLLLPFVFDRDNTLPMFIYMFKTVADSTKAFWALG